MEVWKPITGFEGLYEVSNFGRVKSIGRLCESAKRSSRKISTRILKMSFASNGYKTVVLWRDTKPKSCTVHRLVAETFLPNPQGKQTVNHINGNKSDNRLENLEWATYSENHKHAADTGLSKVRGEESNFAKLTESNVSEMKAMLKSGKYLQKEIAIKFNISRVTVSNIKTGKTWIHI